jgi:hypothetical protein
MTIRELIAKLEKYPLDTDIYDIGWDRGHGYSREVAGIERMDSPPGIRFIIEEVKASYEIDEKEVLLQMYIDMINK